MIATQPPKPAVDDVPKTPSPSERLAKKIVDRLVGKKLLTDELALKLLPRISSGNVSQADWKLVFERSLGMHKKS